MISNSSLYIHIPKFKSISQIIVEKKVVATKYLVKFQSPTAVRWPKTIQPEWISKLICNLSIYTLKPKIKSISQNHSEIKWWQLNIWPNFKVQRPKIIEPEQNVNLICTPSLYTHIPKIKSIFPSIVKKSDDNYIFGQNSKSKGHNSAEDHWTGTKCKLDLELIIIHSYTIKSSQYLQA